MVANETAAIYLNPQELEATVAAKAFCTCMGEITQAFAMVVASPPLENNPGRHRGSITLEQALLFNARIAEHLQTVDPLSNAPVTHQIKLIPLTQEDLLAKEVEPPTSRW